MLFVSCTDDSSVNVKPIQNVTFGNRSDKVAKFAFNKQWTLIIHADRSLFTAEKENDHWEAGNRFVPGDTFSLPGADLLGCRDAGNGPRLLPSDSFNWALPHFPGDSGVGGSTNITACCFVKFQERRVITHARLKDDLSPSATAPPAHCCIMDGGRFTQLDWLNILFLLWYLTPPEGQVKEKSAGGSCLAAFSFGESPSAVSQPKNVRQAGNHAANVSIYTNERCSGVEPGRKSGSRQDKSTGRPSHGNQFLLQLFNTVVAPAKYSPNTTQSKLAAFLIESCIRLSPFHFNGHTRPSTLCAQSWPSTIHLVITESTCENWKMPKLVVFPISLNCKLSITSTAALLLLFSILPWKRIAVPPRRSPWRRGGRDKKKNWTGSTRGHLANKFSSEKKSMESWNYRLAATAELTMLPSGASF